jgi:hypothetical protein
LKPLFSSKRNGSSGYPASSSFGKPTSDSYRLGPLTPGDSKSRINTKISSVPRSRTRLEKSEKPRGFDDNDSEEAINNPNDFNDIEMSRDFRFTEERIERNR